MIADTALRTGSSILRGESPWTRPSLVPSVPLVRENVSSRRGFEPSLISVKTPVSLKVGGGGQKNPRHLLEARLRKALLAAVLQEPLTLPRVRRDRVEDDVRRLPE